MTRLRVWLISIAASVALLPGAGAALTQAQLDGVVLAPATGARVPMDGVFQLASGGSATLAEAMAGRPALLLPVDYACRATCGPALSIIAAALEESGLADYALVVFGLDPGGGADAQRFVTDRAGGPIARSATVVIGGAGSVQAISDAIGYRFIRDAENAGFAHPAAFVTLTPDGRVSRALSSLALDPASLRLALIEAGEGQTGSFLQRLSLRCYAFDAARGLYALRIERVLAASAIATIALLAAGIAALSLCAKRQAAPR